MRTPTMALLASLVATLAIAVPGAARDPAAATVTGGDPAALAEAISFAPPDTAAIWFTDWKAMKAAHGVAGVTSDTPIAERLDALQLIAVEEGPFAGFTGHAIVGQVEDWGWDLADVDWVAEQVTGSWPVTVVRLREDIDLARIVARYDEHGFSIASYEDATIRSHTVDRSQAGAASGDRDQHTAFLDDGRTLVLSSSLDSVLAALGARHVQTFRAAPASVAAGALGAPLNAAIIAGASACAAFDPGRPGPPDPRNVAALDAAGPLRAWEALGVGTGLDAGGDPVGRFVFAYADPGDALADLAGRTLLAQEAVSMATRRPIPESIFSLEAFDVEGAVLGLEGAPALGRSQRIAEAVVAWDLPFATCSSGRGLS